jgi:hypothetical protein
MNGGIILGIKLREWSFGEILILIKVELYQKDYDKGNYDVKQRKRQVFIYWPSNSFDKSSPTDHIDIEAQKIDEKGKDSKNIELSGTNF